MSKNSDHLKIRNTEAGEYEMICEHCGLRGIITPPMPADQFVKTMKKFEKDHAHCLPSTPVESDVEGVSNANS